VRYLGTLLGAIAAILGVPGLVVDSAEVAQQAMSFVQSNHHVVISLPTVVKAHSAIAVFFTYHGSPKRGLTFVAEPQQVYTVFATSEWMPCLDDPSDKATLDLTVVVPPQWTVISHGHEKSAQRDGSAVAHQFALLKAASTYTYGFAAGRFATDAHYRIRHVDLRFVASDLDRSSVRRVFADTPDMLRFFQDKAGVPFPTATFAQVLTAGTPQQELSGFVLLPNTYGAWVREHPQDITLAAHELAHQWWGNRVTCESWNEFWLNEGVATFMAAAYVEHRFGRAAYDRLVAGYRVDYERIRDAGHDKPLVFADWAHPTGDDRTLVYRKGAYVLDRLRETVGDSAFWAGVRAFTRRFDGGSVTSGDFEQEMERASGANLHVFFAQWVFGTNTP
jgi:aminopeptidase N